MTDITEEDIARSLLPKVDHLTYAHVKLEPIVLKVVKVCHGPNKKERPVRLDFEPHPRCVDPEGKPLHYLPCKGMRVVLSTIWGLNGRVLWPGKSLKLFGNPDVMYGGEKKGGIQIAEMSGIDKPVTVQITVRRGVTEPFTVYPLKLDEPLSADDAKYVAEVLAEIKTATQDAMNVIGAAVAKKSQAVKDAVRSAYSARVAELKAAKEVTT